MDKKWKKALTVTSAVLGTTFAVMSYIAKKQRDTDKYKNDPKEQNPMYKKKVVFVENENDSMNADGKRGHLEAVGEREYIPKFYEKYVKRSLDIALSFCGMVVLAPVYAVTAVAIKLDDPGPVIFKQKRVAQNKGYFELFKFRSMYVNMLQNGGITRVGAFIRKTSIDELPQLWNIFSGSMSMPTLNSTIFLQQDFVSLRSTVQQVVLIWPTSALRTSSFVVKRSRYLTMAIASVISLMLMI